MRYLGLVLLVLVPTFLVYLVMASRPGDEPPLDDRAPASTPRSDESAPRLGAHESDVGPRAVADGRRR